MENLKMQHLKTLMMIVVLSIVFSFFTLWLIESWIKYPLFLFEIFTIVVLYLILGGYDVKLTVKNTQRMANVNAGLIIDLFLVTSTLILLIFNVLHVDGGVVQVALALFCTSLLSGYAILNIFGLIHYFSRLETTVLSFILSYAFTAFITLVSLLLNENTRILILLGSFIGLGLVSALKHKRQPIASSSKSFAKNIDSLALMLSGAFYALSFCFMYPGYTLFLGEDISRHYASSIILGRTPDIYIGSAYLLSHLHESMLLSLSKPSLVSAQTALVTLNLILPLAFYIMVKPYLERIDARLPSLATVFWVLFTNSLGGFSWLYFLKIKLSTLGQTQLQLLATTADKTYNGTVYGILGLWYVPAFVSLVVLMATVFLMRKKEIPATKYLVLFSITIAVLYLTHVTEAVIFALFLAVYGAISRNQNLRINDAIKSSILGFVFVIIIYYILSVLTARFIINMSLLVSLIGPISALLFSLLIRRIIKPKRFSSGTWSKIKNRTFLKIIVLSLLFAYAVAFLSWIMLVDSFHTWQVDAFGLVPWFMYPLMLGVNGLLAIIALYYLTRDVKSYEVVALFLAFMIFTFVAGRIVSTINLYFFDAGYWEKRFIWLMKLSLAVFAPIPILFSIDRLKKGNVHVNVKTVASVAIIGIIVLCGVSTTFLNLEYWNIVANNPAYQPSSDEMEAVNAFKEILDNDPKAWLATVTETSAAIATFAAPADQLVLKQLLYTAYRPEMVFTQLYRHPAYSHPYIYLHDRDAVYLSQFGDRFLAQYLNTLPLVFENSEVKIYNASKPSFPQLNSDNVLVIPLDGQIGDQDLCMTYQILSQGFYNYTVAYDLDGKALDAKTAILSFDPPPGNILPGLFEDEFNQTLGSWTISNGSWMIENGKLLGGESGKYGEGIILSPAFAENFTATFKVKPMSGNPSALNYVRLVYSWTDPKNYRIADIFFNADGYVYVLFRTFVGGIEEALPSWSGIKTDLRWGFGSEYDVTVSVNGTLNQISIDGKPFLSVNLENVAGRIGLGYRFYELSFDYFSLTYTTLIGLRPIQDYLDYLRSGGRIILLNTNGYGFFADDLFSTSNSTVNAQRIEGQNLRIDLPREISVPLLTPNHNNTTILSKYIASSHETPFILRKNYGSGELFYCNIYPLIEALHQENNKSAFYETFGNLLDDLDLSKLNPDVILTFDAYVKEIILTNGVKVETTSLLFPLKLELEQVDVKANNSSYNFHNVTSITLSKYSTAIIETDNAITQGGNGFYTIFQMNSTFSVKPSEGSINLKITANNEEFILNNVSLFSTTPNNTIQLLARIPKVSASEVNFIEFYPQDALQWQTRTYGQNLKVTGLTEFSITLSDSYSALGNVKLGASFQRDPPIVMFDELSTFPTAIFFALLLLPIFVGISFIFRLREPSQDIKQKGSQTMSNQNIWELSGREKHRQKRRAQATAFYLNPTPTDLILDIGCGQGFITSHLLKASLAVGLDASKNSLSIAKQKLRQSNVEFVCADATVLPIRTATFNKIAMLEILEHLPEETRKKLCQEVDRILKENGILIVSVPYKEKITYTRCVHCGKLTPLWGHLYSMDEGKVKKLLSDHYILIAKCHLLNVELISTSSIFKLLPTKLWLIINSLLGNLRKGYWIILKYKKAGTALGR